MKRFLTGLKNFGNAIVNELKLLVEILTRGSVFTKVSFVVMGFGNFLRGQIIRGILFLATEGVFIWYMITSGAKWISKLKTLGDTANLENVYDPVYDAMVTVPGDNSFKILLYGLLTVMACLAVIITWRMNIGQSYENDRLKKLGKKIPSFKDDLHELLDKQFHKTLLAIPVVGISMFTIMPIIFMILVAFTQFDANHDGSSNLFTWVGWQNFAEFFGEGSSSKYAFFHILGWTLIWAFIATFSNYFLGMILAIMINKKGIKFKKIWRGIFVLTIAIPQFISLLYISKWFSTDGIVNAMLIRWNILEAPFDFWSDKVASRILVLVINLWVGIPYLMLIATGILMNIPEDLYEAARIDGASSLQRFFKITLPYMLFVTGPYLLTSFIGNMGNFNVIYLLAGGAEPNPKLATPGGNATNTDLLITWLFKISTGQDSNYKFASVVGILIFIVIATISTIGFNLMKSNKNEEEFQ